MRLLKHVILKWNEMPFFHRDAPDTIYEHAKLLKRYSGTRDQYTWWGKISVTNLLGNLHEHIASINKQALTADTYLYLYCPDSPHPTMHIGKLAEISCEDQSASPHTPAYYRDLAQQYNIPFWFKLTDIMQVPLYDALQQLITDEGLHFDPVCANRYPMVVYSSSKQKYFENASMYTSLLGGHEMKCFKTGNGCACSNSIIYKPNQVFIGCPFTPPFLNMVDFAIKPVLAEKSATAWVASDNASTIDIMCKVCQAIQASGRAIIDITDWNANVLFELGLLYGNAKSVLLLNQKGHKSPIDLSGIEYLEYDPNDYSSLQEKLRKLL